MYNCLNLPSKFTKDDGTKQDIIYDFSGKKWQEKEYLADGNIIGLRSYLGSFQFEGNTLSRVFHGTGFIENKDKDVSISGRERGSIEAENISSTQNLGEGIKTEYQAEKSINLLPGFDSKTLFSAEIKPFSGYEWNYILKDHLGNTRVLFTDKNNDGLIKQDTDPVQNEILSISNYSPFGLELGGSHQNLKQQFDYKFNGKQENGFSGLTDFGARWLDKPLAVFHQVDPSSELRNQIPVANRIPFLNNPISNLDLDGRYAVSVHYNITYQSLRSMGYSHKSADLIAHYSSTYADHPESNVMLGDRMGHAISPEDNRLAYRRGINYSSTVNSQDEINSLWHSMMSDSEKNKGYSKREALLRGLKFGWDNIFDSKGGNDLGKVGQGLHALQDAYAHGGMSTSEHLDFTNISAWKQTFGTDMYGGTAKASSITKSAIIVMKILNNEQIKIKKNETLNFTGMKSSQLNEIINKLYNQGFRGKINISTYE